MLGNHEPFLWLHEYEKEGPKEIVRNFRCLRRSGVIELCGLKIAYLSRVFSPKTYFEGHVWNPEKDKRSLKSKLAGRFTPEDVETLIDAAEKAGEIDILALHENPNYCKDERGKEVYRMIVDLVRPRLIVCGHMHDWRFEEFCGTRLVGVARGEVWVLDTDSQPHRPF